MKKKTVLIVGAGNRVKNTVLPALGQLSKQFEIKYIVNRSQKTLRLSKKILKTTPDWRQIDFASVDVIIIAVTLDSVPAVVRQIQRHDVGHITLFIDTPVLAYYHLSFLKQLEKQFQNVFVSEEAFVLPHIEKARKIIRSGRIGNLKHIYFISYGYQYHALATLKFLSNSRVIRVIHSKRLYNGFFRREIVLENDVTATVIEPQDYSASHILIFGDKGTISNYHLNFPNNFFIKEFRSYQNLKVEAFKRLLIQRLVGKNVSYFDYTFYDSFTDQLLMPISEKLGYCFDIRVGNTTFLGLLLRIMSAILPSRLTLPAIFNAKAI